MKSLIFIVIFLLWSIAAAQSDTNLLYMVAWVGVSTAGSLP